MQALTTNDLPKLLGVTLLVAIFVILANLIFVILANLIVDILYAVVDPRVRV